MTVYALLSKVWHRAFGKNKNIMGFVNIKKNAGGISKFYFLIISMEAKRLMQTKPQVPSIYKFLSQLSSSLLMFLLSLTQNPQALQSFDQPSIEDYLYCQTHKEIHLWFLYVVISVTHVMMTKNHVKSKIYLPLFSDIKLFVFMWEARWLYLHT